MRCTRESLSAKEDGTSSCKKISIFNRKTKATICKCKDTESNSSRSFIRTKGNCLRQIRDWPSVRTLMKKEQPPSTWLSN